MKKAFAVLIAFMIIIVFSSACAEATHRRGVIEFCELYMYRFMKLQHDSGLKYDIRIIEPLSSPMILGNTVLLNSVAGTMEVNTDDYTVSTITMTFIDLNDSDEKNEQNGMSCIMAFSALEYNNMDELKLQVNHKMYGGAETAAEEALILFTNDLADSFDEAMKEAIDTGKEVKFYSGNYDYYIAYNAGTRVDGDFEYIYLIAHTHE